MTIRLAQKVAHRFLRLARGKDILPQADLDGVLDYKKFVQLFQRGWWKRDFNSLFQDYSDDPKLKWGSIRAIGSEEYTIHSNYRETHYEQDWDEEHVMVNNEFNFEYRLHYTPESLAKYLVKYLKSAVLIDRFAVSSLVQAMENNPSGWYDELGYAFVQAHKKGLVGAEVEEDLSNRSDIADFIDDEGSDGGLDMSEWYAIVSTVHIDSVTYSGYTIFIRGTFDVEYERS